MERYRVYGLLVKIEAVSGTDAAPDPAVNAIRTSNIPELKLGYLEAGDRSDVESGTLGMVDAAQPAGRFGTLDVTVEVKGAGAAYAAGVLPECDPFMRASGFSKTLDVTGGAEKVSYTTLDSGMETATVWCYAGHKLIKLIGCVMTMKLSAEANKRGFLTFSIVGRVAVDPTDVALPALTLSGVVPPLFKGATASIGAWTSGDADPLVLRKVDVDDGAKSTARPSAGATDGHAGYVVVDRKVRQTMAVEVVALATFDPFTISKAAPAGKPASSAWAVGSVQYNRMKVVTGRWALEAPGGPANTDGIATWNLTGGLVIGTAVTTNREINVTFD